MNISFVICTGGDEDERIDRIIDSIEANNIPTYEIIIVGGPLSTVDRLNTFHIPFNEGVRRSWITRKKNIATERCKYDVVVYLHDYHVFDSDWYAGLLERGDDWDIQMNRILTHEGKRMLDWVIFDHPEYPRYAFIPYDRHDLVGHQYISGGYWVAKRSVMLAEPLDENRVSHQMEDVEWSLRVRNRYRITMNPAATVRHVKVHRDAHLSEERARAFGVSL